MRAVRAKTELSLKMRAIALLAQRDQSPAELRRKLLRLARQRQQQDETLASAAQEAADPAAEVEQLLAWLQAQGYLSEARFVESRVQARAQRWGTQRIRQELAQHGLSLSSETEAELKSSELDRARCLAAQVRWRAARGCGWRRPAGPLPGRPRFQHRGHTPTASRRR